MGSKTQSYQPINNDNDLKEDSMIIFRRKDNRHIWINVSVFVSLIWLLMWFCSMAVAAPTTVLKCGTNEFSPFGYTENGEKKGIEVELLYEIGKRLRIQIDLDIMKWPILLEKVRLGVLDCMFAAFKTEDRIKFMDFTNVPFHISSLVLFVNKEKPFHYRSLDDLNGRRIGIVKGFKNPRDFERAERKGLFQVFQLRDLGINFRILEKQCIDAVFVNRHVGEFTLNQMKLNNVIQPLPIPITASPAYIAFTKTKDYSEMISMFDSILFEIIMDGTYKKIFNKYMHSEK